MSGKGGAGTSAVLAVPDVPDVPDMRVAREATTADLVAWDSRTVTVQGGDVQQSRAWAEHRARTGWRPHHLVLDDGSAVLALGRPWRGVGGGRLYVPRGPVTAGASASVVAARLGAVVAWAREAGCDAVVADPEIPASSGYPELVATLGFRPAEEIGPSRHRVAVPLGPGSDEAAIRERIDRKTRQRFSAAERKGTRIVRYDRGGEGVAAGPGSRADSGAGGAQGDRRERGADEVSAAFERFHLLLQATGARRGFEIGSRATALAWWQAAFAAGYLVLLEAWSADDAYLGASIFYRHGERLTYSHSADVVDLRHVHTGTVHLLLWRALQLAAREGRTELDLGGVDVRGARHEPRPGEPMFGLLEFKRSFGGEWVEQAGAQELVLRPVRHALANGLRRVAGAARSVRGAVPGRGRGDGSNDTDGADR